MQKQAMALIKQGRKDRALMVLKLKKLKTKQSQQVDAQLLNVYELIETISWETENLRVFRALEEGKNALNDIHKVMSVDAVEQLMEDNAEAQEVADEIGRLLSDQSASADPELADDAFEAELAALEAEFEPQQTAPELPQVPDGELPVPVAGGATAVPDLPEVPTAEPEIAEEAAPEPVLA